MKTRPFSIILIFLLAAVLYYFFFIFLLEYKLAHYESGVFAGRRSFTFNNGIQLIADVGQEKCAFEYRNFVEKNFSDLAGYTELDLNFGRRKFEVTNHNLPNGELKVNNVDYRVDFKKEHLLISQDGKIKTE
jgi:hypothetical protein